MNEEKIDFDINQLLNTVLITTTNKIIEAACPDRHQAELLKSTFTTFAKRGVPPQTAIEILLDLVKIFENYQPNDTNDVTYRCKLCDETFDTKFDAMEHLRHYHVLDKNCDDFILEE